MRLLCYFIVYIIELVFVNGGDWCVVIGFLLLDGDMVVIIG